MKSIQLSTVGLVGILMSSLSTLSIPIQAQKPVIEEPVIEEIVVTGIRGSLNRALHIKREAASFVDAVSAEDVGKLPDQNVAESLQRIPGVAIERTRGEGDFVSIRGLGSEFVRATVNGRTIATGEEGRSFNFDTLASESIGELQVIKSPTASLEEGGIGGTVNVITARALDLGIQTVLSARVTDDELSDDTGTRISGLTSWTNDEETLGLLLSVSLTDRQIREDQFGVLAGYLANSTIGFADSFDTDLDGLEDDTTPYIFPLATEDALTEEDRQRLSLNGSFEVKFDEDSQLVIDFLYTNFEEDADRVAQFLLTSPVEIFGAPADLINADGSHRVSNITVGPGNLATTATHSGFNVTSLGVTEKYETKTQSFGINFTDRLRDRTRYEVDLYHTKADQDRQFRQAVIEATATEGQASNDGGRIFPATYQLAGDGVIDISSSVNLLDPSIYTTRNVDSAKDSNEDEETGLSLDFEWEAGIGLVDTLQYGFQYRSREKTAFRSLFRSDSSIMLLPLTDGIYMELPASDFANPAAANYLYPVVGPWYDYVLSRNDLTEDRQPNAPSNFTIEEDVLSGYFQINLDTQIAGMPLSGNLGVRIVRTESASIGVAPGFIRIIEGMGPVRTFEVGDLSDTRIDSEYSNVLPSLNLKLDITEELVARFSYSEVVNRPELSDLSPRINVNPTGRTGDGGNPELEPFESDQFDVGLEWYFAETSALTFAYFDKDIGNVVTDVVQSDVNVLGQQFLTFARPENASDSSVSGLEFGYYHAFDFLPVPFDGFGIVANYTNILDSEQTTPVGGDSVVTDLEGVSDSSFNIILYYDIGRINARIAYNSRENFVSQAAGSFGNVIETEGYDQLDLFASYDITDSITLFVEGINITNEIRQTTTTDVNGINGGRVTINSPLQNFETGARWGIGIRGTF